eukprot:g6374.t1
MVQTQSPASPSPSGLRSAPARRCSFYLPLLASATGASAWKLDAFSNDIANTVTQVGEGLFGSGKPVPYEVTAGGHEYTCPGSRAWIHHASCAATFEMNADCDLVKDEVLARVEGKNGWEDPHNHGKYSVLHDDPKKKILSLQRDTNSTPKYTDLMLLTFISTAEDTTCSVSACSESQITSYLDFSTNYCNLRNLLCGSKTSGCKTAKHAELEIVKQDLDDCAQSDAMKCSSATHGASAMVKHVAVATGTEVEIQSHQSAGLPSEAATHSSSPEETRAGATGRPGDLDDAVDYSTSSSTSSAAAKESEVKDEQ